MSLWNELKRRNVFRVAAAYLVFGWLLLQVAAIVLGFTGAPEWVGKALIALLLLGFVPVLALAWVFEVGPGGIRLDDGRSARDTGPQARRLDLLILIAVVLVMLLFAWQQIGPALRDGPDRAGETRQVERLPDDPGAQPRQRLEPEPFEVHPGSVAVLPFANRSVEADTAHFVDGIHDDLITELARNPGLRVISRTSMMEYRDTSKNLRQIGEELAVAHVLEGAVQRAGSRVRINAQLIDASTDAHLWAENFDRGYSPESVFEIQSEIAGAIADALGRALGVESASPAPASAPTVNPEAWDSYLRARATSDTRVEASLREAIELYRRALEQDPEFALAMGELGLDLTNLYWFWTRREGERIEARQWIDRALTLEPEQPRLRWILARYLYHGELDYDGALAQLALAERDLPGSAEVMMLRGWILRRSGRVEEALEAFEAAAVLDPRSVELLVSLVETYGWLGRLEASDAWGARLARLPTAANDVKLEASAHHLRYFGRIEPFAQALIDYPVDPESIWAREILLLPYLERDFERAMEAIAAYPLDPISSQFRWIPKALLKAKVAQAEGQESAARDVAEQALTMIEGVLDEHPDDHRAISSKAFALALAGRTGEAREQLQRVLDLPLPREDVLLRGLLMADGLWVLALIGDSEELARQFEVYYQLPYRVHHFDGLMLDPVFDRHRDHPAMRAVQARYSRREPEA